MVGLPASTLVAGTDPLSIAAHTALECLLGIGVGAAWCSVAVDNVLWAELADVVCNSRDDVAAELLALTEVLALQAELVLLGHVASPCGTDLIHDVQEDSFRCTVALSGVLGRVTNVASSDVHGAIGGEGNAVGELLAPAYRALITRTLFSGR